MSIFGFLVITLSRSLFSLLHSLLNFIALKFSLFESSQRNILAVPFWQYKEKLHNLFSDVSEYVL